MSDPTEGETPFSDYVPPEPCSLDSCRAEIERLQTEPHLGCATNLQLIEEMKARWALGHTEDDYRTVDP